MGVSNAPPKLIKHYFSHFVPPQMSCTKAQEALPVVRGNYTTGPGALAGVLCLPTGGGAGSAELRLEELPDRIFAVELAALMRTAVDAVAEKARR